MKIEQVDLFGLVEIGINPSFPGTTEEICQIFRKNWTHAVTTLTNTKQNQQGLAQYGGASITTTRHWVSRVVERGHDKNWGGGATMFSEEKTTTGLSSFQLIVSCRTELQVQIRLLHSNGLH